MATAFGHNGNSDGNSKDPKANNSEQELIALRAECARLREKLAQVEAESRFFRNEFYEKERRLRRFEDVSIADLANASAGPVELI